MAGLMPDKAFLAMLCCQDLMTLERTLEQTPHEMLVQASLRFKMKCDDQNKVITTLTDKMDTVCEMMDNLTKANEDTKKKLDSLEKDNGRLKTELSVLMKENATVHMDLEAKDAELLVLQKEFSTLKSQSRVYAESGSPNRKKSKGRPKQSTTKDHVVAPGIEVDMDSDDDTCSQLTEDNPIMAKVSSNRISTDRISTDATAANAHTETPSNPQPNGPTPQQATTSRRNNSFWNLTKVPPMTITDYGNWFTLKEEIAKVAQKKVEAKAFGKQMKLTTADVEDYTAVSRLLVEKKIPSVIFNLQKENIMRVVIKRIVEDIDVNSIKSELQAKGLDIRNILRLPKSKENLGCPLILVCLPNNADNKQIFNIVELAGLSVMVVPYEKKSRSFQCFNCQRFGHGANSCHMPPRCVKCGRGHASRDCLRPRDKQATCANCKGSHPSNYRNCPAHPKSATSTAFATPFSSSGLSFPALPTKTTDAMPTRSTNDDKRLYSQVAAASSTAKGNSQLLATISQMIVKNNEMMLNAFKTMLKDNIQ